MNMKRNIVLLIVFLLVAGVAACGKSEKSPETHKLRVVTTLFPLYDFAKNIGGEKVEVTLLLPPGIEPHSFEPRPADLVRINNVDLFIYTNQYMEPWVGNIIKGIDNRKTLILDSSRGVVFMEEEEEGHEGGRHEKERGHAGMDPHIWLDLGNAIKMVDTIRSALVQKDPANNDYYQKNAAEYKAVLERLDRKFQQGLSNCKKRTFINGGHFAFGYLAKRYGLAYISAYGISPDAEPRPGQLAAISRMLKQQGLKYIFYEELLMPRMAGTLARETGAQLLFLHGAHNISREDFDKGVTFVGIMGMNLNNLETGLQCR